MDAPSYEYQGILKGKVVTKLVTLSTFSGQGQGINTSVATAPLIDLADVNCRVSVPE
jgi:hypothetical protein